MHTRPRAIRAADRLRAPFAPRGTDDPRRRDERARLLKISGIASRAVVTSDADEQSLPLPRIREQRPLPGTFHPASPADIRRTLAFLGAECIYGVRSITLACAVNAMTARELSFGRLIVPGRIILAAQLIPPWTAAGRLSADAEARLRRAGATIASIAGGTQTVVGWPDMTLRDFMLFDVLMHEVGHHIMQHHTGKRSARVARTKDHEAFADAFARQCRARSIAAAATM